MTNAAVGTEICLTFEMLFPPIKFCVLLARGFAERPILFSDAK